MYVYANDPEAWGDDEAAVYSEDRRYVVNLAVGYCDCPDNQYRNVECKHLRRAQFALRERPLPEWATDEDVDLDSTLRRKLGVIA